MTRVKKKKFFEIHDISFNEEVEDLYNSGWTLDEIKEWKEYIQENYNKEVKNFRESLLN